MGNFSSSTDVVVKRRERVREDSFPSPDPTLISRLDSPFLCASAYVYKQTSQEGGGGRSGGGGRRRDGGKIFAMPYGTHTLIAESLPTSSSSYLLMDGWMNPPPSHRLRRHRRRGGGTGHQSVVAWREKDKRRSLQLVLYTVRTHARRCRGERKSAFFLKKKRHLAQNCT